MTILEAINRADLHLPNRFSTSEKLAWLSRLDGMIHQELHRLYEGGDTPFGGYDETTALSESLLVEEPFAPEVYLRYLESRMDDANGDTERFRNSLALFRAAYKTYYRWYNRTHQPRSSPRQYR
ncbi:MAG: hypothetical protein IJA48_05440 [Oscillospiraceae bacterium]|nr:hypothetical protein [Oscillospiraceae bacterium]